MQPLVLQGGWAAGQGLQLQIRPCLQGLGGRMQHPLQIRNPAHMQPVKSSMICMMTGQRIQVGGWDAAMRLSQRPLQCMQVSSQDAALLDLVY